MNVSAHRQITDFIWGICNLLRGPYKRNEYRKVILPLTVLRRFDCVLAPTKQAVLDADAGSEGQVGSVRDALLKQASGYTFYNTSRLDFGRLLDDADNLAANLVAYIEAFSDNVREIMRCFGFAVQIERMAEKELLFQVVKEFAGVDLSPGRVDNMQMGYIFEELIRIGAEQANEEAGEHFTPREVIRLMVSLLLSPEPDLGKGHVVKTIYDPACGTGGMLSVAEDYLREHNRDSRPHLYGQDFNDEAWAVCKSDMLIKGHDADGIILGDSFTEDGHESWTFDYMLANPPFGVEWKQQKRFIESERRTLGWDGRFGAGTPRINDGALLFLQHMLSKMTPVDSTAGGGGAGCWWQPHCHRVQRIAAVHRWCRKRRERDQALDHRERLARGHRGAARPALLQHRDLHLHLGSHEPQGTSPRRQGSAHRRAAILHQDAQEPRQQAQRAFAGSDR